MTRYQQDKWVVVIILFIPPFMAESEILSFLGDFDPVVPQYTKSFVVDPKTL